MKIEIICKSVDQTNSVAQTLARTIKSPQVISLCGDLGAGKTTFARFFINALGIAENVTSPTFTLLNEYEGKDVKIYHFDMYRLENSEEAFEAGFERYFSKDSLDGITLVEWAENAIEILPKEYLKISFMKLGENERKIIVEEVK